MIYGVILRHFHSSIRVVIIVPKEFWENIYISSDICDLTIGWTTFPQHFLFQQIWKFTDVKQEISVVCCKCYTNELINFCSGRYIRLLRKLCIVLARPCGNTATRMMLFPVQHWVALAFIHLVILIILLGSTPSRSAVDKFIIIFLGGRAV